MNFLKFDKCHSLDEEGSYNIHVSIEKKGTKIAFIKNIFSPGSPSCK